METHRKIFVPANVLRDNAWRMAARIFQDGFYPDVIYIALRGGSSVGNPVSEFFKWVRAQRPELRRILFAAVAARSYTGLGQRDEVRVEGWTYDPAHLRAGDKVLLVDDIFDRGLTINHLVGKIMEHGIPRADIKVAVHDYKIRRFQPPMDVTPDYWCVGHDLYDEDGGDDPWIHYLSHELEGMTRAEMEEHLPPDVADLLLRLAIQTLSRS